jgi:cell division cycle protein 37
MSKPFDYSKWDKIELSDDEEDVHPNIDKESWFRMKHRSRVEREEQEAVEVKGIYAAMEKANQRIQVLQHDLKKLEETLVIQDVGGKQEDDDDDDDDDDGLDDTEGIKAELNELLQANELRNKRLQEIEKQKKWNVDNICEIKEERTIINSNAAKDNYTPTGFAKAKEDLIKEQAKAGALADGKTSKASDTTPTTTTATASTTTSAAKPTKIPTAASKTTAAPAAKPVTVPPPPASAKSEISPAMETYHEFTVKYSEIVEEFMQLQSFEASKEYLLKYGDILLQENASNYLLLASLEDEMNGFHTKMKLTCRQSQIISNITELAKSMKTHPGNMVLPFFARLEQKELLMGFMEGVTAFCEKIAARAVTKKAEMDRERMEEEMEQAQNEGTDLEEIPKEERLGPGGLDPLEVIETLPLSMQQAFESRDVEQLKAALLAMDPDEAQYHMKRCVDSGLWCDNS